MVRPALSICLALSGAVAFAPWVEPILGQGERAGQLLGQLAPAREGSALASSPLPGDPGREVATPLTKDELETELARETAPTSEAPSDESPNARAKPPARAQGKAASRQKPAQSQAAAPKHGLRVREEHVLRLARVGVIPSSRFVAATAARPAGLELSGVSALGIGMREGDVLTHVAGVPVSDRGQVINLVLQARARRAPQISARFSRGGEPWMLVVDLPYPEPRPARPPSGKAK